MRRQICGLLLTICANLIGSQASAVVSYRIPRDKAGLKWTGYKFTTKAPVHGSFDSIAFESKQIAKVDGPLHLSVNKLFETVTFSIDTMSMNSGLDIRDRKLLVYIFGGIVDPGLITGKVASFNLENQKATARITMNGVTRTVPFKVSVANENYLTLEGTIDLVDFKMAESVARIHQACEKLHTGPDNKSKTWSTVDLEVRAVFEAVLP